MEAKRWQQSCFESQGNPIPTSWMNFGHLNVSHQMQLVNNVFGIRGYANDNLKQCLYKNEDEFGWTWQKGETNPECLAPEGGCPAIPCYYQMTFAGLNYGIWPSGQTSGIGITDLPVNTGDLKSLVVSHDMTFEATDDLPGYHSRSNPVKPGKCYARHQLIYDLLLMSEKPEAGINKTKKITDEIIIMLNYNYPYPDYETCNPKTGELGDTQSPAIEEDAVHDGCNNYHYHSFTDLDTPADGHHTNYHQFRRLGGEIPGAPCAEAINLAPFFEYLKMRYDYADWWLGQVLIGQNIYDHTHGKVTFHSLPMVEIVKKGNGE
jgi:hypothetical protein